MLDIRRHTLRRIIISCMLLLWIRLAANADEPVTLHCTSLGYGTPIVELGLGEGINGKFLLDTGASTSLLSDRMVSKLKLVPKPYIEPGSTRPGTLNGQPVNFVYVPKFYFGNRWIVDMPFIVCKQADLDRLNRAAGMPAGSVNGVLGANFFSESAFLWDIQKQEVTFWFGGNLSLLDLQKAGMADAPNVPLTDRFYAKVRVRINDQADDDLFVDTGAVQSAISYDVVKKLNLKSDTPVRKLRTFSDTVEVYYTHIQTMTLGSIGVIGLEVGYSHQQEMGDFFPCIGMDVLKNYRLLLDVPKGKMYFKRINEDRASKHD